MDDKALRLRCIQELDRLPDIDSAHIGVTSSDGIVTLAGHVATYAEKVAAERAVVNMGGVRAVAVEIEVHAPDHLRICDEELAQRCANVISWDSTVAHDTVVVKVEKGCVTLSGWVDRYDQKAAADRALRRLAGVTDIVNTIGVRSPQSTKTGPVGDKDWAALY